MTFLTLMTDFGIRDAYPGVMEGVIYRIAPTVTISHLTHMIPPQNIGEGALVWARTAPYFPAGTVHVAVVDPGVGTARRPMAARLGSHFFVCPDNGLITRLLQAAEQAGEPVELVHLNRPQFWLPQVSNVFHGRDIFAPSAAHLAAGVPLRELGDPVTDPVRLAIPAPQQLANGWRGEVTTIDHFGNVGTNVTPAHLNGIQQPVVRIGVHQIHGIVRTFGDRPPGSPVAFIDSDGTLSVAIVQGNASQGLKIHIGDIVEVTGAA